MNNHHLQPVVQRVGQEIANRLNFFQIKHQRYGKSSY